jgi:hypothetical protein
MSAKVDETVSIAPLSRERPSYDRVESPELEESAGTIVQASSAGRTGPWVPDNFAQQQLRALIQRVFFPGWPKASRQVVISSADAQSQTARVCARIAREMAAGLPGTVCAVEADMHSAEMAQLLAEPLTHSETHPNGSMSVAKNLWLVRPETVIGRQDDGFNSVWLRTRLSELRRNFDYTLIHAPAAFLTETVVLGQLADGIILVIEARRTRRAVALRTLEILKAARVAVLGTVLTERTFPIPEKLYSKL